MKTMRITSPGVLLIFAIVSAGGIFMMDVFFLKPHTARQEQAAVAEQAADVQQTTVLALSGEAKVLSRVCATWSSTAAIRAMLSSQTGLKEFHAMGQEMFRSGGVEVACLCRAEGRTQFLWTLRTADQRSVAFTRFDQRRTDEQTGLIDLGDGNVGLYAQWPVQPPQGSGPGGHLRVARRLDIQGLGLLGDAVGGELTFVRAKALPEVEGNHVVASRAWWVSGNKLAVAWLASNPAGEVLGYFRATVPMGQLHLQAASTRRTVLIILSMSVGLILLIIMGVHMLVAGPVVRLMRRLQQIEAGTASREGLTDDLHGEPLAVARRLESAFSELDIMSKTDQLTSLSNRRHFEQVLLATFEQARRYNRPLSVMVIDIDFFKAINDAAGHQAGDEMIRSVGAAIQSACRKADLPSRFGGDEFAVMLPESRSTDVAPVAERIRQAIAVQPVNTGSIEVKATCSIGIADLNSGEIEGPESLINLADRALYAAKELGRNRCVMAQDLDRLAWPDAADNPERVDALSTKLAGLDSHFKDLFVNAVEEVIDTLEERNPHMADHARRVRHVAVLMAREMELPERMIKHLASAAMLHDIGMLALPDSVLLARGDLNEQQWQVMRRHPQIGARILQGMEFLEQEVPAVRHHHEHYDGTGYPDGLAGAEIPLPARILALSDAFEAMTSTRAFRPAKSLEVAVEEIKAMAGAHFDPVVVEAFVSLSQAVGNTLLQIPPKRGNREIQDSAHAAVPGE